MPRLDRPGPRLAETENGAYVPSALGLRHCPDLCRPGKIDATKDKKLGELRAITSSYEQTDFVMKAGWATFPGTADPNRSVAEGCASALLKTAAAK